MRVVQHLAGFLLSALACLGALTASAQCYDWAPGTGTLFNSSSASINTSIVFDDGTGPSLYIGGSFSSIGGVTAQCVARWDGSAWRAVGPKIGSSNSAVSCMAVYDDGTGPALYVGGQLSVANGAVGDGILKLVGGTWQPVGSGVSGWVYAMKSFNGKLYVGGNLTTAGGAPTARMAAWNGSGWQTFAAGPDNLVRAFEVHDDGSGPALYVGGSFTSVAGVPFTRGLARWSGSAWSSVSGGTNGNVLTLLSASGAGSLDGLYVGGEFTYVSQSPTQLRSERIARWRPAGWSAVGSAGITTGSSVNSLALFDPGTGPRIFIGGAFNTPVGSGNDNATSWNGTAWQRLGSGVAGAFPRCDTICRVPGVATPRLLFGGNFTVAGGKNSEDLAFWPVPCYAPVIFTQPTDKTAVADKSVTFSVTAEGTETVSYQWRRNGVPLTDITNRVQGSSTPTLTIGPEWTANDVGAYTCRVSNAVGSVISAEASFQLSQSSQYATVPMNFVLTPPVSLHFNNEAIAYVGGCSGTWPGPLFVTAAVGGPWSGTRGMKAVLDRGTFFSVVHDSEPLPALGADTVLTSQALLSVASEGVSLLKATLVGSGWDSTNNTVNLLQSATGLDVIYRAATQAPGFPEGTLYASTVSDLHPAVNASGQVLFGSSVSGATSSSGLWLWTREGGATLVARGGDRVPGSTASIVPAGVSAGLRAMNSAGLFTFDAYLDSLTGIHNYLTQDTILLRGHPGSLERVFASGDPAPGFPSTYNLETSADVAINDAGQIGILARVAGPANTKRTALYRAGEYGMEPIAVYGDEVTLLPAPGFFTGFDSFELTDDGWMLFHATVGGSGANQVRGVWMSDGQTLYTVWNNALSIYGLDNSFSRDVVDSFSSPRHDRALMCANVTTAAGTRRTLIAWTSNHGLFAIAAPGSQVEVSPGVFKTVASTWLDSGSDSRNSLPRSFQLQPDGSFLFLVSFTDGTNAVCLGSFDEYINYRFPAPQFLSVPASAVLISGGACTLNVSTSGKGPISYEWYKDGILLVDGPSAGGGTISGATTPQLTINLPGSQDAGGYKCVATNSFGLDVTPQIDVHCQADLDVSFSVDLDDLFQFFNCFDPGLSCADIDGVPGVDVGDFFAFFNAFDAGC